MMNAIRWWGPKEVHYDRVPKPRVIQPTDAILRVTATTICGSDLHLYAGEVKGMQKGDILGHEFMGFIEEVGPGVASLKTGDRVVVSFDIACGACEYCQREEFTSCNMTNPSKEMKELYGQKLSGIFGYSHLTGGYPGGQAEYVRVPYADHNCLMVPMSVPDDKALFLSDVLCTSFYATEVAGVQRGQTVGIWGLGPIGLLSAMWCRHKGAGMIIGIDCVPERLELARDKLGITVINFNKSDPLKMIWDLAPRGLDAAIDACGFRCEKSLGQKLERAIYMESDANEVLSESIIALRKKGKLALIGDYFGTTHHFPIGALMEKGIQVGGGQAPVQKYWREILSMVEREEIDPSFIVTHKITLRDVPTAYDKFFNRTDGYIKVFVTPN